MTVFSRHRVSAHPDRHRIGMLTTAITDASDPTTLPILQTAAKLGIRHYKLGYYPYTEFGTLRKQHFSGPISLHSEYQGPHSFRDLTVDEVFTQTAKDATLFCQWWDAAK